jgi:hypothetical protein
MSEATLYCQAVRRWMTGRDCVKSRRSSYTGLYPQNGGGGGAPSWSWVAVTMSLSLSQCEATDRRYGGETTGYEPFDLDGSG